MKYIGFWEYEPEKIYNIFELGSKLEEEYGKDPASWEKKYGKFLGAYWLGMEPKGFGLFDFDVPEQMINVERAFWPYKKFKFVPIFEEDEVKKVYLEKRK